MKYITLNSSFTLLLVLMGSILNTHAQEDSLGEMVSRKVGVYVFPAEGQQQAQLEADQTYCYKWATSQSKVDPLNPPSVRPASVDKGPDGSAIRGSAVGAAEGAAIGAIAGNAGRGAAIGAVAGVFRGRRQSIQMHQQQQAANNQAAAAYSAEMINNFKKAYIACLEGKGYTAK